MQKNTKTTITLEVDLDTLRKAEKILSSLPCTLDQAVDLYLGAIVKEGGIPFKTDAGELKSKQKEENLRLIYGEVNYLDTTKDEGLFDLGPET
jgi:antitoxin component of RelBE/YafQ-DinJ toxin-antitoxin module